MRRLKILIVDEEQRSCEYLRTIISPHEHRIDLVAEARDGTTANALMASLKYDVVLLDYSLLHSVKSNLDSSTAPPTIVTLAQAEKSRIIESFRLGAFGIVLKGSSRSVWRKSILTVFARQYWIGTESLAVLVQAIREGPQTNGTESSRHFGLTPREIEIVQKIAAGRSNKEVGQEFSIQERTVKHHLTNIFGKVGVSSRLELALLAREHQIVKSEGPIVIDEASSQRDKCLPHGESPLQQIFDAGQHSTITGAQPLRIKARINGRRAAADPA